MAAFSHSAVLLDLPSMPKKRGNRGNGLKKPLAFTVEAALTSTECAALIAVSERQGFMDVKYDPEARAWPQRARKSGRCVVNDEKTATLLWGRLESLVPSDNMPGWRPVGIHPSLRFLRYGPGEYFLPHFDKPLEVSATLNQGEQRSFQSIIIYLNTVSVGHGGGTVFSHPSDTMVPNLRVSAREGTALVFDQDSYQHEGEALLAGKKYALRTDIMYQQLRVPCEDGDSHKRPRHSKATSLAIVKKAEGR